VKRDRREYHRALRKTAGYAEAERQKQEIRMRDPAYAERKRAKERERRANKAKGNRHWPDHPNA
jgi:hypothetical protein